MAMSHDDATRRSKALNALNAAFAEITAAQKRVDEAQAKHQKLFNDMKSEMGTANAELHKAEAAYTKARDRLLALTPELPVRTTLDLPAGTLTVQDAPS